MCMSVVQMVRRNFWLKPTIELARNIGLSSAKVKDAERLVESRQQEIIDAWNNHFGCRGHKCFRALHLAAY